MPEKNPPKSSPDRGNEIEVTVFKEGSESHFPAADLEINVVPTLETTQVTEPDITHETIDNDEKAAAKFSKKRPSTQTIEERLSSEVLELRNALRVLNDRYANNQVELDNLKEMEKSSWNRSSQETPTPPTSWKQPSDKGGMPELEAALLHSEILFLQEKLGRANKEVERLSAELILKADIMREFELERRQNIELYEKQLQIAQSDFKRQVAVLEEKHNAEKARFQRMDTPEKVEPAWESNTEDSNNDGLVMRTRSKFEGQISRLENIHKIEMCQLRTFKASELDRKDEEIEAAFKEMQRRDQNSIAERNGLMKTIDSLRKELEKKKNIRWRPPVSSPARGTYQYTSPPRYPAPKSRKTPEFKELYEQMKNMKTAREWENHNLREVLRRQHSEITDTDRLHQLVSTLTQGILEKEDIIKQLKASQDAMGQQMLAFKNEITLLREKG